MLDEDFPCLFKNFFFFVPNLRFPDEDFECEWKKEKIRSFLKICNGQDQKKVVKPSGKNPIYGTGGIIGWTDEFLYDKPSVCIGRKGTIDKPIYLDIPFWTVDTLFYSKINARYCVPKFVLYLFETIPWKQYDQSTGVPSLTSNVIESIDCYIPNILEQTKLSHFFDLIDKRIETQSKIIEKLESQMKVISDRIFNFAKGTPITLKKLLNERNERTTTNNQHEVLSSTVKGLFLQKDYFNKNIASENNIGYKIVRKNDIIISPQNLWLGNITYNDKFDIGIVSPSYKIFEISDLHNKYYVAYMMRTKRALYSYVCVSEQGASVVRRNLNMELFEELVFTMPDINTQNKIGSFLKKFSDKISLEKAYLDLLKKQKNFLLKNMFI